MLNLTSIFDWSWEMRSRVVRDSLQFSQNAETVVDVSALLLAALLFLLVSMRSGYLLTTITRPIMESAIFGLLSGFFFLWILFFCEKTRIIQRVADLFPASSTA